MRGVISHYYPVRDPFGFQAFGRVHYLFVAVIIFMQVISSMNGSESEVTIVTTIFCSTGPGSERVKMCGTTDLMYAWTVTMHVVPMGAGILSIIADRWTTRKVVIYYALIFFSCGCALPLVHTSTFTVLVYSFMTSFSANVYQTAARVLLIEIIPNSRIDIISALLLLANFFGRSVFAMIYVDFDKWHWVLLGKLVFSLIAIFSVPILPESPQWYFLHNDLDASIAVVEEIARLNKTDTAMIRYGIEEAWRATRTRPKSRDGLFDLFYYPRLTHVFVKSALAFFVDSGAYYMAYQLSFLLSDSFYEETILDFVINVIAVGYFSVLTKRFGRKNCIAVGFFLNAVTFGVYAIVPGDMLKFVFGKMAILVSAFVFFNIETVVLELSPTGLRVTIVVIFNYFILSTAALTLLPFVDMVRDSWLAPTIMCILLLFGAYFLTNVPETKGTSLPASTREAESFLIYRSTANEK